MSEQSTSTLPALWACHECRLIGPAVTAVAHHYATGHPQERVSDEMAAEVRKLWASEGRSLIDGAEESSDPPNPQPRGDERP